MGEKVKKFLRRHLPEEILLLVLLAFLSLKRFGLNADFIALGIYALLVLILEDNFLARGLKNCGRDLKKNYLYAVLVFLGALLLFIWQINGIFIIFFTIFLFFLVYSWDSRLLVLAALASLLYCSAFLITKQDLLAEKMAAGAYYFLALAITLELARSGLSYLAKKRRLPEIKDI